MIVFDSSALIALAQAELGARIVGQQLNIGHISCVNASEFVQKLNTYGDGEKAFEKLEALGLTLHDVLRQDAYAAASIIQHSKPFGLSLGDRLCLALAQRLDAEVYTADQIWEEMSQTLSLNIRIIR